MSVIGKAADAAKSAVFGPVVKAVLEVCDDNGKVLKSMQCGFNPTEYSISHSINYMNNNGLGEPFEAKNLTFMKGTPAMLSVSIIVDQKSNLESTVSELGGLVYNKVKYKGMSSQPKNVKQICQYLSQFMHYDSKNQNTPLIGFTWGDMRFLGKLTRVETRFTMFDRDGSPTRAKLGLSIVGDDTYFMKSGLGSSTKSSSSAREQASSSGTLNPRKLI